MEIVVFLVGSIVHTAIASARVFGGFLRTGMQSLLHFPFLLLLLQFGQFLILSLDDL